MLMFLNLAAPLLQTPIACQPNRTCWIQKYVDIAPGPQRQDYRCGPITMDGHDGVDFRIGGVSEMKRGVAVVAAAPGIVARVRDGVPDAFAKERSARSPPAGNGVVVDHGGGWETQYSHLRRDSIRVRPGQKVGTGSMLGLVGLSGETEYPHLHFSVRHEGKPLDPFGGAAGARCGTASLPVLWSKAALTTWEYRRGRIAAFAITTASVPSPIIGDLPKPTRLTPIVAVAELIGPEAGQQLLLELLGPGGVPLVRRTAAADRPYLAWVVHWGLRPPAGGWRPGRYTARISRPGQSASTTEATVLID